MRISDWSSDVCSSDLPSPIDPAFMAAIGRKYDVAERDARNRALGKAGEECVLHHERRHLSAAGRDDLADKVRWTSVRSEEHTSELQSLMRISYAVFCLKKTKYKSLSEQTSQSQSVDRIHIT